VDALSEIENYFYLSPIFGIEGDSTGLCGGFLAGAHNLNWTGVVRGAWYAIVRKKKLYTAITNWIQDFHTVPHHQIYRLPLTLHQDETILNQRIQIERTQRLFVCYYQQAMPETLAEIDMAWRNRNAFENTVVAENDSNGSDFDDDDDDDDDSTIVSDVSRNSIPWVNAFASWLTCWDDPFPEQDPWYQLPFLVKKSNDSASTGQVTFDDEEEESMWVVFDDKKREEDDAVTFLTMDEDSASTTMDNKHMEQLEQPPENKSLVQQRPKQTTTQESEPTVMGQEEPKGWELFKTKFRIAVMILQELE
jgi:hypothetical protein